MNKVIELRNQREKISGLYIGINKGQENIFKFGCSECLQNRIYESVYQTGFYYQWEFILFIPHDQTRNHKEDEVNIHNFLEQKLKMKPGHGIETFPFNNLKYDVIVDLIYDKLKMTHTKISELEVDFKNFKVFDKNWIWDGPFNIDEPMICKVCNKEKITKTYFTLTNGKENINVGKNCLDKIKSKHKIKHKNKRVQHELELFGDDIEIDNTISDEITLNTTLNRYTDEFVYKTPCVSKFKTIISNPDTYSHTLVKHASFILIFHYFIIESGNDEFCKFGKIQNELNSISDNIRFDTHLIKSLIYEKPKIFKLYDGKLYGSYCEEMFDYTIEFFKITMNNEIFETIEYTPENPPNKKQKESIYKFFNDKLLFLTGLGGTGKSYVSKSIIRSIDTGKNDIYALGPYNIIVERQKEEYLKKDHKDLHKDLLKNVHFKTVSSFILGLKNKIIKITKPTLVIVDEFALLNIITIFNLCHYLKPVKNNIKLLFLGDFNQLPSINLPFWSTKYINFFKEHNIFSVLTENMRTANSKQVVFSSKFLTYNEELEEKEIKSEYDIEKFKLLCLESDIEFREYKDNDIINLYNQKYQYITLKNETCHHINKLLHKTISNNCLKCTKEFECDKLKFCRLCIDKHKFIINTTMKGNDGEENLTKGTIIDTQLDIDYQDENDKILINEIELSPEKFSKNLGLSYCLTINKFQESQNDYICYIIDIDKISSYWYKHIYTASSRHRNKLVILYINHH